MGNSIGPFENKNRSLRAKIRNEDGMITFPEVKETPSPSLEDTEDFTSSGSSAPTTPETDVKLINKDGMIFYSMKKETPSPSMEDTEDSTSSGSSAPTTPETDVKLINKDGM